MEEDIKVSQLPEASAINDEDLLMIVQNGVNKKITKENCQFASGDEISIGTTEPTGEEKIWIDPTEIPSGIGTDISNVYSDATDKAYSCNYINNSDSYSTSEIKTNKTWIDGKPIYRKTLYLEASTTTQNISITSVANNIGQIWIDVSSSNYSQGGIISDWETSGRYRITIDSGAIYYVCSNNSYKDGYITFNYTKTTD